MTKTGTPSACASAFSSSTRLTGEGPDDAAETGKALRVAEDDGAEAAAVDGAGVVENLVAEGFDEEGVAGGAGGVGLMGDDVGVDDAGAEGGEEAGDLALAGGDAAREADGDHAVSLSCELSALEDSKGG